MDYKKELKKTLKSLSKYDHLRTVFFDFVETSALSLSNGFDLDQYEPREERYMKIISKYPKNQVNKFGECLAYLIMAMDRKVSDILGELYMELGINDKSLGQIFTPMDLSRLTAELAFDKESMDKTIAEKGYAYLLEPCVGGGAHVIAFADVMRKYGYNYQTQLKVYCNDIDPRVLMMCYVQLSILGIDAICVNENALTLERKEVWFTPFYVINRMNEQSIKKRGDLKDKTNDVRKKIAESSDLTTSEQLSLF